MLLTNEVYIGVLAQGKRGTPNYKVRVVKSKDESEWVKVENCLLYTSFLLMVFYPFNIFVSCCTDAPGRMEERCCIMRSLDSCGSR